MIFIFSIFDIGLYSMNGATRNCHTHTHTQSFTHWLERERTRGMHMIRLLPTLCSGGRFFRLCAAVWVGVGWFLWCLRVYVDCFILILYEYLPLHYCCCGFAYFRRNLYLLIWTVGVASAVVFTCLFAFAIIRIAFGRYLCNFSIIFHC